MSNSLSTMKDHMGVSLNGGTPKSSILIGFSKVFHYKPSILGYPYFWKHPYSVLDYLYVNVSLLCLGHHRVFRSVFFFVFFPAKAGHKISPGREDLKSILYTYVVFSDGFIHSSLPFFASSKGFWGFFFTTGIQLGRPFFVHSHLFLITVSAPIGAGETLISCFFHHEKNPCWGNLFNCCCCCCCCCLCLFVRLHSDSKTTYQIIGSLKSGRIWSCSKIPTKTATIR